MSFIVFWGSRSTLPWLEAPELCVPTHPEGLPIHLHHSTFIQLQLDSFRKNHRNTENSTTLADMKKCRTWKTWKQWKHTANHAMIVFGSTIVNRNTTLFAGENDIGCHIGRYGKHCFDAGTTWRKIGFEKDPQWFCLMITMRSSKQLSNDSFYHQCCVSWSSNSKSWVFQLKMCHFNVSITEVHVTAKTTPCLEELVWEYLYIIHSNGSCVLRWHVISFILSSFTFARSLELISFLQRGWMDWNLDNLNKSN